MSKRRRRPELLFALATPDSELVLIFDRAVTGNTGISYTASGGNPTLSNPTAGTSSQVIKYDLSRLPAGTETGTLSASSSNIAVGAGGTLADFSGTPVYRLYEFEDGKWMPNPAQNAACVSTQAGDWDDTATWVGGAVPTSSDDVILLHTVTVRDTAAVARGILIPTGGKLAFDATVSTRLTVTTILTIGTGEVEMGTEASPVAAAQLCEIVIRDTALPSQYLDPWQVSNGLVMLETSKIRMWGATKTCKASEVRLSVEPLEGHTTLTFETNPLVGWRAGDKLVIPPTEPIRDVATNTAFGVPYEGEEVTIQSVANNVVTLTGALTMDHLGAYDDDGTLRYLPHVINMTRNVVIRSETENATVRGHTLFADRVDVGGLAGGPGLGYALFKNLGRTTDSTLSDTTVDADGFLTSYGTNQRGRYPIHFHHWWGPVNAGDTGYQADLLGVAIDDGKKWSFTLHEACYVKAVGLNIYDCQYSGIQLEGGNEAYNLIDDCVIFRFVGSSNTITAVCNGITLMEGMNNTISNNVTAWGHTSAYLPHGIHLDHLRRSQPDFAGGPYRVPLFRGADLMNGVENTDWESVVSATRTYTNSGNEACAITKGNSFDHVGGGSGITYTVSNHRYWGGYQESNFVYGGSVNIIINGLTVRKVASYGVGIDSQEALVTVQNADIQTGSGGFGITASGISHSGGAGADFSLLVEDSTIIAPVAFRVDFPTSVGIGTAFNTYNRVTHFRNVTCTTPDGQVTPSFLDMSAGPDVSRVPMLPIQVFVEDCTFDATPTGNLQAFWNEQDSGATAICEDDIAASSFSKYAALTCELTNAQALVTDGRTTGGEITPAGASTLTGVTGAKVATRVTATVAANGTTWTLVFSGDVTTDGTGFSGSGSTTGAVALTYSSGTGTNTLVFTGGATIVSGETVTLSYANATGNVEAETTGWALPDITAMTVTNNSGD